MTKLTPIGAFIALYGLISVMIKQVWYLGVARKSYMGLEPSCNERID